MTVLPLLNVLQQASRLLKDEKNDNNDDDRYDNGEHTSDNDYDDGLSWPSDDNDDHNDDYYNGTTWPSGGILSESAMPAPSHT